jgi:hypothetical protein
MFSTFVLPDSFLHHLQIPGKEKIQPPREKKFEKSYPDYALSKINLKTLSLKGQVAISVDHHVINNRTSARTPARGLEAVPASARFGCQRENAPRASDCATSGTVCSSYGK